MIGEEENNGARSAVILAILVVVDSRIRRRIRTSDARLDRNAPLDRRESVAPRCSAEPLARQRLTPIISLRCPHPRRRKKQVKPEMLRAYIYEFVPPWTSNSKIVPSDNHVDFRFDSGQDIVFFDPEAQLDTLRALKTTDTIEYSRMRDVFSEPFFESNYDLYNSVYSASPAQTSPFMNGTDAMRKNVLLLWKLGIRIRSARNSRHRIRKQSRLRVRRSRQRQPRGFACFQRRRQAIPLHFHQRPRFVRHIHARRYQHRRPDPSAGPSPRTLKPDARALAFEFSFVGAQHAVPLVPACLQAGGMAGLGNLARATPTPRSPLKL